MIDGDGKLIVDATAVAPSVVSDGSSFVLLAWIGRTDRRISGAGGSVMVLLLPVWMHSSWKFRKETATLPLIRIL